MKLGRFAWSELRPIHKGSETLVTYGVINGIRLVFVTGSESDWMIGPMFGVDGIPREMRIWLERNRPSVGQARRDCRRMLEKYFALITTEE